MEKELCKKIGAYSGLATAILFASRSSNAQIIYTDIPDVKINHFNSEYSLDLNNDGIYDFGFRYDDLEGIVSVGVTNDCDLPNNCQFPNGVYISGGYRIAKFSFLDTIGPSLDPIAWYLHSYRHFLAYSSAGSYDGAWAGGESNGYFAMRFKFDQAIHYAWGRVGVKKDASILTIKDFAYNSVPGASIQAGDEGCTDNYEPNEYRNQATVVETNTLIRAQVASSTDKDWYSFSVSADNNLQITLTSLLFDFNLKLFDGNGIELAKSANTGGKDDTIVYNNLSAGNYFVKVYGKNGKFSDVDCYSLFVESSENPFRESLSQSLPEDLNDVTVYPNPFSESAYIEFSLAENEKMTIELFDLQGRKMMNVADGNFDAGDHKLLLDKGNLNEGIYLLQVKSENGIESKKVIVQ